jgi:hypothetical protein
MALSYVWVDHTPPETIFLHGIQKSVTPNLFAALRQLRDPNVISLFWMDVLCIDQDNVQERNHQVQLMSLIYSKAARVLMWLGEDIDKGRDAVELLAHHEREDQTFLHCMKRDPRMDKLAVDVTDFVFSQKRLPALKTLLQRSYWSRVWIIQEVILANDPIICCGSYAASCVHILNMFKAWEYIPSDGGSFYDYDLQGPIRQLADTYFHRHEVDDGALTLFDSLLLTRDRFAERSHDYIFGILGIIDLEGTSINPDYISSLFSLYRVAF